jgi:fibronectin-binding autotransporter adhesin
MRFWTGQILRCVAAAAAVAVGPLVAYAANGTWNLSGSGDWDTPGNWVGGTIADGSGFTANFTQPDLTFTTQVNLPTPRTIGNLVFADSNPSTGPGSNWELVGVGPLTLAGTTPTATVNAMNAGGSAILSVPVAGTAGLTKAGAGTLALGAVTHTFTGGINVDGGTLRIEDGAVVPAQSTFIRNGATLSVPVGIGTAAAPLNVPAGMTANLVSRNGVTNTGNTSAGVGGGAGSTLNISLGTDGHTISADGNWATGGSLGTLNVSGVSGGLTDYFRIRSNGGAYTANSLAGTSVNLNDIVMFTRTNSGGNTIDIGALSGTATAVLSGGGGGEFGGSGTGSFATYTIGALGTNTTFAGKIDVASAQPDAGTLLGGINITKTGAGTLTLSGDLTGYVPTANTTANRRGAITTISGGTLKLAGSAVIPGGISSGGFESTLRFQNNARLDISTAPGPYSTQPFQNIIGVGTIVGNFTHDEGLLAPGDTLSGTTPTPVAAAGTMTFDNNLSFAGNGQINFNLTNNTATGNDRIQVNGSASLTGNPTLNLSLIGGVTTGSYTIVNAVGGFGATNASGWTVVWPGRGSAPALSVSGNNLLLTVTANNFGNLRWSGTVDGTWAAGTGTPTNWVNASNAADSFFDNDNVTFGDTYGAANTPVTNSTISLNSTVNPLQMTFNSNTAVYSITGAGRISGAASLTKTGSTLLTLQTANDFIGPASITGSGGVDIGSFQGALGTGQLTLNNTKLTTTVSGFALTNASVDVPTGTSSEVVANGGGTLTFPGLTGGGNLLFTSDTAGRQIDLGTNTNYTGNLTFGSSGSPNLMVVRANGTSMPNSKLTLNNVSFRDRATSAQVQTFGALEGDANSQFQGYNGGSTSTGRTYRVGSLNLSTQFDGVIMDSINAVGQPTRYLNFVKIGAGTLTLTGANTYSGDTRVEGGTLVFTNSLTNLFDASDVWISAGAKLVLNTSGVVDTIDALFLNGLSMPVGTYGPLGSEVPAAFQTPLLEGSGRLAVTTFVRQADFNGDFKVDKADADILRSSYGINANGDVDFDGDTDGNDWLILQRRMGFNYPMASVAGVSAAAAVPEPGAFALAAIGLACAALQRRRK